MTPSSIQRALLGAWLVGCFGVLVGCGGAGTTPLVENVARVTAATEEGDFAALVAEAEAAWTQRGERAQVEAAIAAWELAVRVPTPSGVDRNAALYPLYVDLSKAYYWLAHGHLRWEDNSEAIMLETYQIGMERAQTALALNNDQWTNALRYETPIPEAVSVLGPSDVPAMYWYATNLGRWGLLRGIATVLANVPDIKAMMDRVEALDATFFFGAPDRYFGVYYTKLPFGNPDLDQSRMRLERAIERYPGYLETRVLLAEEWARVTQNREIFETQLQAVIDADLDAYPELRPENENALRRAQYLVERIDEYFR